jgi:hypothetical protein
VPRGVATLQAAARPWIPRAYTLSWQDAHEPGATDGMDKPGVGFAHEGGTVVGQVLTAVTGLLVVGRGCALDQLLMGGAC